MSKTEVKPIASAISIFKQYRDLGAKAMEQITEQEFHWRPDPENNSICQIVQHLHGNMKSRWTDFLTTDGEKSWRMRDAEFEEQNLSREQVMQLWEEGWQILLDTLESLTEEQLSQIITIRSEPHSVFEAINRQIAHYSYHVGQIVYLAKSLRSENWKSLSIPKNKSAEFNKNMNHPI